MDKIRFSSLLKEDDIRLFLIKYAGFETCELGVNTFSTESGEMIQLFSCNDKSYSFIYSDSSIAIKEIVANSKPREVWFVKATLDDWICLLRVKFGMEFVKYYAETFAEKNVFENSTFISQLSNEEFFKIVEEVVRSQPSLLFSNSNLEVIELESFYLSERRFLVQSKNENSWFVILRITDFGPVDPKHMDNSVFNKYMTNKFGKTYIDAYQAYLIRTFECEVLPKFISSSYKKMDHVIDKLRKLLQNK